MKKLFIALTLVLSFIALSSTANAQMPTAWGVGGLFQSNDATLLLGYTAIETNQPVFQVYDCEVDAFVFQNGTLIGAPFSVGLNFAEIAFSAPATLNVPYDMIFQFFLLPVDFCGGFIDYYGFSIGWGADYTSPFAWEGRFPIVCVAVPAVLLGRFLFSGFVLPTLSLDSVTPDRVAYGRNDQISTNISVSASAGIPANLIVVLRPSYPSSATFTASETPPGFCINDCMMTGGNTAETKSFNVKTKFTFPLQTTFPLKLKVRVSIDPPPATVMLLGDPFKDSAEITIN